MLRPRNGRAATEPDSQQTIASGDDPSAPHASDDRVIQGPSR
jgi:hypothetical protein